jgi:protein SCO1/2
MRSCRIPFVVLALLATAACSPSRQYELRGQVLAVDRARREITIKHEDIRGFMPAMTMPFKVRDERLLEGWTPGDLVRATLVVRNADGYLSALERTGHAPLVEPPPPPRVDLLAVGDLAPDGRFTDQSGRARRLSDWRGQALAVTFIYTRCPLPNFCPLMDRHFADVQRRLAADAALRGRVHLLSISFDPAFDTPPVLASHAARVGADGAHWTFLTGTREEIDGFAAPFGVSIFRQDEPGAEIVHNLRTAVIDAEGRIAAILNGTEWTPDQLFAELRTARGVQ